jgi:hypothetical protein
VGIRETLNRNPIITTGATIGIILIAIIYIVYSLWPKGGGDFIPPAKTFYSVDDGATWFEESAEKVPPFTHNGKEAVRAHVFVCNDGTTFVGYLERYNAEGKAKLDKVMASAKGGKYPPERFEIDETHKEYKKPGARNKWITPRSPEFQNTMLVKCKDGSYPRPKVPGEK